MNKGEVASIAANEVVVSVSIVKVVGSTVDRRAAKLAGFVALLVKAKRTCVSGPKETRDTGRRDSMGRRIMESSGGHETAGASAVSLDAALDAALEAGEAPMSWGMGTAPAFTNGTQEQINASRNELLAEGLTDEQLAKTTGKGLRNSPCCDLGPVKEPAC